MNRPAEDSAGKGMQILHLFANYKWTGPADPAIRCAQNLRLLGEDVRFSQVCWTLPGAEHRMAKELWQARMPVIGDLELRKHFNPLSHLRDAASLRRRIDAGEVDLLHSHQLSDQLVAAWARRRSAGRPLLLRSLYEPEAPAADWRHRFAMGRTDGLVVPLEKVAQQMVEGFAFPRERILVQEPPTDPARARMQGDLRAKLGLDPKDLVIGITARIQPHRRFEMLWECARQVIESCPRARFVLLGRGNEEDTRRLVQEPIGALGIEDKVTLPGYLLEPEYSLALRSLDLFLFLVPGSDGTCRAVREAMLLGLPVVATNLGILPDLVAGEGMPAGGLVCSPQAEELAAAILRLSEDESLRSELGRAAAARAREGMDPGRAARELLDFYAELAKLPRRGVARG
ncbi:MAG: glycosyltransferase family 4 protein [Planctomycetota bacterium]|jgi:glycosyltransferase involved in cell wall biosynthesis